MAASKPGDEYLSISQFAARIGVSIKSMYRYKLPPHDIMVGKSKGWKVSTVDAWQAQRPGRGYWGEHRRTRGPSKKTDEAPRLAS